MFFIILFVFAFRGISVVDCFFGSLNTLDDYSMAFPVNECLPRLHGADWILSLRQADYGWGDDTHRAIIALVVNRTNWSLLGDKDLMVRQLEIEISKALFRNSTTEVSTSDLSLYIHALLGTQVNPRKFYGEDLVAMLEFRVLNKIHSHPLAVLALCNAGVVTENYLSKISPYLVTKEQSSKSKELQAIALTAFMCAEESFPRSVDRFRNAMNNCVKVLAESQEDDGSFGNVYTTSLVVQALVASNYTRWNEQSAIKHMESYAGVYPNMLSTYYVLLALNCRNVRFIKNIAQKPEPLLTPDGFPSIAELKSRPKSHYIQYTIRAGEHPSTYFTVTTQIPMNATFFDVMRLVADEDDKFRFSYSLDNRKRPIIYSVSGIPNDAQKGYYWRLIFQEVDADRRLFKLIEESNYTNEIFPGIDTHWIFWRTNAYRQIPEL